METAKQNQPAQETGIKAIRTFLDGKGTKERFEEMLGKRAPQFITSIMQIISSNKDLHNAEIQSIYNAAATAAILDLPLNNNLQFAHLIPYKDHKTGVTYCQFQMGWRGFVQLAQRSGKFSTINVTDVRQGELKHRDRLTGDCTFEWEQDEEKRETLPVIGWVSYFRLTNGFEKPNYWSVAKLKAHAKKYSKTYDRQDGKWNTDFDAMCAKTVIKENLNKWAPLSVEMAQAIQADQAVIKGIEGAELNVSYDDNPIQDAVVLTDEEALAEEIKKRGDKTEKAQDDLLKTLNNKKK